MSADPVLPSAAARRPSAGRNRFVVLLATALILASSLLAGTPAGTGAATDWEVVLLGQYRLGDTESHKVLIREAVANWLESEHAASGAAAVADEVQRLAGIPKAERDRTFSGWLVARLYNGVFTDEINRTPAEQEFYEEFQGYYGSMQLVIAKSTLAEWEAYLDPLYPVQPRYGSPPTLGLLWDTGKSFSGFIPPNNAMNIGDAGFDALHEILDPAAASVIPGARAAFIRSGYNPPDGSKTAAALATAGFVGGTFAVMYGAIAAHAAATLAHVIAVTSIVNEVGTTIAGAASTALSAGSTATSFVMGAVVILPLLIAGGMKIADLAQMNTFGDKLRFAIAHPDFHADLLQITGFKTDLVDGLWYLRCNSGFEGIGTVCWSTDCPATYHLAGLSCTRDATSTIRQTYVRPASPAGFPDICPPDAPNFASDGNCYPDPNPGYTCTNENCIQTCPAGWATLLTTCFLGADVQPRDSYGRGAGSANSPVSEAVTVTKSSMLSLLLKMLIADPADLGVIGAPPLTPVVHLFIPEPNKPPLLQFATYADLSAAGGVVEEGKFAAIQFGVYDPNIPETHVLLVDWGDGTPAERWSVSDGFIIRANPSRTYADDQDHTATLTIRDAEGLTDTMTIPIVVKNVPPTVAAIAEVAPPGSAAIQASFSDPGTLDTWTATVNWGDGGGPVAVPLASLGSLTHNYGKGGTFDVTVAVTDDDLGQGSKVVQVVVAPPVDLTVEKSDTVGHATQLGGTWDWRSTITNAGTAPADFADAQVIYTDTMPATGVTYGLPSIGTQTGITGVISCSTTGVNVVICRANGAVSIAAGGTFRVDVTATPTTLGTFVNPTDGTARVDPDNRVVEVNESNNDAAADTVSVAPLEPPSISKAFGRAVASIGATTRLTFTVTNPNSGVALTGVTFNDPLPIGLVVSSPNNLTGSCGGGTITATGRSNAIRLSSARLAAGSSCTFGVDVTSTTLGRKQNVTSRVTSTNGGAGNQATATLEVRLPGPDIAITKTHTGALVRGGFGTYSIVVRNVGLDPTHGEVRVVDVLPAGLSGPVATAPGWSCSVGGPAVTCRTSSVLAPGSSYAPISIRVAIGPQVFVVANRAFTSGGGELSTVNNWAIDAGLTVSK